MDVSEADLSWVKENYPDLAFKSRTDGEELVGKFCFDAAWDEFSKTYLICHPPSDAERATRIRDCYQVQIVFPPDGSFPILYEVGGRILARAKKLNVPTQDLHIYESGETCPVGPFDRNGITDLRNFIDRPVLQYFYDQSHHEKFGEWPRGQYSHGIVGVIENYADCLKQGRGHTEELADRCLRTIIEINTPTAEIIRKILTKKQRPQGHHPCICGSAKNQRSCHHLFFHGIWSLHQYLQKIR